MLNPKSILAVRRARKLARKGASGVGSTVTDYTPGGTSEEILKETGEALNVIPSTLDTADAHASSYSKADPSMPDSQKKTVLDISQEGENDLGGLSPDPNRDKPPEIYAQELGIEQDITKANNPADDPFIDPRQGVNEVHSSSLTNTVSAEHVPDHDITYRDNYRVPDIYDSTGQYTTDNGEQLVFPDYIASEIERAHNMFTSKDVKSEVFQLHDEVHGLYKSHLLFKKIPYHLRNLTDNLFWRGTYLAENYNINNYQMAFNVMKMSKMELSDMVGLDEEIGNIAGRLPSELYETMTNLRVFNPSVVTDTFGQTKDGQPLEQIARLKDWGRELVGDTVADAAGKATSARLSPTYLGAQVRDAGAKWQDATENWFRASLFFDRIRKGDSDKEALRFVNKIFFDYDDLSNLEKNLGKRAFSWYTFHAKNIPLQLGMKLENPKKLAKYMHAVTNMHRSTDAELDTKYMAEFHKGDLPLYIRTTPNGDTEFFLLGSWISDVRFGNIHPSDWGNMALSQLNPFFKKPTELLLNYDSFRRRPLEKYPGETGSYLGFRGKKKGLLPMMMSYYADISMLSQLNKANPFSAWGKSPKATYKGGDLVITDPGKRPTGVGAAIPLYDETSAIGRGYDRNPHQRFLYLFIGGSLFAYDRATSKSIEYNKFNSKYFPGVDVLRGWLDAADKVPDKRYGRAKFRKQVAVKTGAHKVLRETQAAMDELKLMDIK